MSKDDAGKAGYGRPPKDSRFKPGRSGNPRGRPKGVRNLRSDFNEVMTKRVRIREDGELRYVSRQGGTFAEPLRQGVAGRYKSVGPVVGKVGEDGIARRPAIAIQRHDKRSCYR